MEISLADLVEAIRKFHRIPDRVPITSATKLEDDLGITGDDGSDLIDDLQKRFGVSLVGSDGSLRAAFDLADGEYLFHSEGFWPFEGKENVRQLTVGQLLSALTNGHAIA